MSQTFLLADLAGFTALTKPTVIKPRAISPKALPHQGRPRSHVDPVCRMSVDPKRCAGELKHRDMTFHFCWLECASAFAADPDKFAEPN